MEVHIQNLSQAVILRGPLSPKTTSTSLNDLQIGKVPELLV